MPNRILKESICTSDTIATLSAEEEVFFYRLLVQCDDFGRFDGRPAILKARCYPLRPDMSEVEIEASLASLARAGLVVCYEVKEKVYLEVCNWTEHQRIRIKRSRYPEPSEGTILPPPPPPSDHSKHVAADGGHLTADASNLRTSDSNSPTNDGQTPVN